MKVWVTKYALTKGVLEVDAKTVGHGMVGVKGEFLTAYYSKRDWHASHEQAIARAKEMREAKLASLEKKIKKLEALDFSAKTV